MSDVHRSHYPRRSGAVFAAGKDTIPTHRFDEERKRIEISGVTLQLVASPGETNDQLYVHLAAKEYLQPFYGNVEFGVRSVFSGYFGWFDGNPTNLFRLRPQDEA